MENHYRQEFNRGYDFILNLPMGLPKISYQVKMISSNDYLAWYCYRCIDFDIGKNYRLAAADSRLLVFMLKL